MLVPDLLRKQARRTPELAALIVDGVAQITYGAWEAQSNQLARGLVTRGITAGDRVALAFENADAHKFAVAYMGVHKAGAVNVPLNMRLSRRERDYILDHCGASMTLDAAQVDALCAGDDTEIQVPRADEDLADILYTSGTTGTPKGVACEHGNVTFTGSGGLGAMFRGATLLHAVPVFSFAGTHAMMLIPLRAGMTTVVQPRFDAGRYLELIDEHAVAMAFAVPSMIGLMLERAEHRSFESLRLLIYGTAPMPAVAIRMLPSLFPRAMLVNMYGLTEGGAAVCSLPPLQAQKRPGSVGKPVPPAQVRVDESGEVWLRAPVKPRRYYRDEDATRDTWTDDGWLRTGDIGYVDDDGYLYLVDRKKDLIIRGGFNIAAAEVENALLEHPAVREAAVVGIPHEILGEDTKAFVVVAGDAVSPDALEAFCRERLADYKVPRTYAFVSELPRNALGKVLKRELRA